MSTSYNFIVPLARIIFKERQKCMSIYRHISLSTIYIHDSKNLNAKSIDFIQYFSSILSEFSVFLQYQQSKSTHLHAFISYHFSVFCTSFMHFNSQQTSKNKSNNLNHNNQNISSFLISVSFYRSFRFVFKCIFCIFPLVPDRFVLQYICLCQHQNPKFSPISIQFLSNIDLNVL